MAPLSRQHCAKYVLYLFCFPSFRMFSLICCSTEWLLCGPPQCSIANRNGGSGHDSFNSVLCFSVFVSNSLSRGFYAGQKPSVNAFSAAYVHVLFFLFYFVTVHISYWSMLCNSHTSNTCWPIHLSIAIGSLRL